MIVPAITLYQPWAQLIIVGIKTIETRTHARFSGLVGKTIAIHAGKQYDREGTDLTKNPWLTWKEMEQVMIVPMGSVIGTVDVVGFKKLGEEHSAAACIDCKWVERWGLFLANPVKLPPVKVIGEMGIWYYDLANKKKVAKPTDVKQGTLF